MAQLQTMMAERRRRPGQLDPGRPTSPGRPSQPRGDSSVGAADRRAVEETLRLADLWLDPVTTLRPPAPGR